MDENTPKPRLGRHHSVVVIGGGQAGLSMSYELKRQGIDHVVLEKHRIAHEWRERRWDTFCLVTPNWQCRLPGFPYHGPDPHGFMLKDEIVRYVEDYARSFGPPLIEGVSATALRRDPTGGFALETSAGSCHADQVVVATGGYHIPAIPRLAERLPDEITQLHASAYRNAGVLPAGDVMVVGSGQSGSQIAEDLHLAGRRVHLCLGSAPRTARRYRGRDVVAWLDDMGYYSMPVHEHPLKERVRGKANHYVTGRDGGRDIDLRQRAKEGMRLYGRLRAVRAGRLEFAGDLRQNLDQADAVAESIKTTIDKFIAERGLDAPTEARYVPVWEPSEEPLSLDLARSGISTVIWCTGFSTDYRWIEVPIFDGRGYPLHTRGVTAADGLYFVGLPWLYTWGSGRFSGVATDAAFLGDQIAARLTHALRAPPASPLNELALGS
ncbi:MAG TPA: MSMEG_0569 family flavin-dependent oxidoreductase [Polyangia bacterium]|nr:MSMEG_0569 family flavin-dependent oxidoreductase [Polyangia bacterium]